MEIKKQFKLITEFFEKEKFDYALIGAFALYTYGYTRATRDIDFITKIEYQKNIVKYLESIGFETLNQTKGYSNHLHPIGSMRFDFVYISGDTADIIFQSIKKKKLFEDHVLPVVSPEHLIALKLFAIKNEPGRKLKELADIKEIYELTKIKKGIIYKYLKKYDLEEYYNEIIGE